MSSRVFRRLLPAIVACWCTVAAPTSARQLTANPSNYEAVVRSLRPGDEVTLEPGLYGQGLSLHGIRGTAEEPIRIRGVRAPKPTVFIGRAGANTISLSNTAHVQIRDLVLDGRNLDADGVKAEGHKQCSSVHNIVLENLLIVGYGVNQQVVAISSLCPAWGWVIRGNVIIGAGTGLYLGQSDGTAPFVGGLIERNLIVDTLGYNMQIKHQTGRPGNMPAGQTRTLIRHNVFSKAHNASQQKDARPNVLLGHFPAEGPGSEDVYEVTANLLFCNPTESLLQAEGNLSIAGNLFVNAAGDALAIQPHQSVPKRVTVESNFVTASGRGISIRGGSPLHSQTVNGNRIFSPLPLERTDQNGNFLGPFPASSGALLQWVEGSAGAPADARSIAPLLRSGESLCSSHVHPHAATLAQHPACQYVKLLASASRTPRRTSAPPELHKASACPSLKQ
jgi:hypothetical protein